MAVFLMNVCKFNGCGIIFPTLRELIHHIEETHIDFDPNVLEKKEQEQPSSLPISYILRVFTDAVRREGEAKRKPRSQSPASSICSSTPNGSEMEEDIATESEDSNDSWVNNEEFSSDFILRMIGAVGSGEDKPFACPIPGCKKRYKNINGIKYHAKNGHRKDNKAKKTFKCHCGKSYKTTHGLKNHSLTHSVVTVSAQSSKGDTVTSVIGTKTATLALLIQGQNMKDSGVLTKLANATLSVKDNINGSTILPLATTNSSYIPLELSNVSQDQKVRMKVQQSFTNLKVHSKNANAFSSLPLSSETVSSKVATLSPVLQQHLLSSNESIKSIPCVSLSN